MKLSDIVLACGTRLVDADIHTLYAISPDGLSVDYRVNDIRILPHVPADITVTFKCVSSGKEYGEDRVYSNKALALIAACDNHTKEANRLRVMAQRESR